MNAQVAVIGSGKIVDVENQEAVKAKALEYLTSMGLSIPQAQKEQFIELCVAMNLNPFKREIYGVGFKDKFNIIVGYEVYLKRADSTKLCTGWRVRTEGSVKDKNLKAIIEIHRKDYTIPFIHEVDFAEYEQIHYRNGALVQGMWQTKPKTMIKKVAVAQGFRLAFPNDFSGMPYIEEELQKETTEGVVLPAKKELSELAATLAPLGINLEQKGTMAVASGSAVFSNNSLLKEIGFIYDKNLKSWIYPNVAESHSAHNDSDIIEAEVTQEPANKNEAHKSILTTMADLADFESLTKYLEGLGLKIAETKANTHGCYFAKIEGDLANCEAELIALGAMMSGAAWVLNIDVLYKQYLSAKEAQENEALF